MYLGEEGYSPIEIIRYYYGSDMYINSAVSVAGVPSSWPGYNLSVGSVGDKVRRDPAAVKPDRTKLSGNPAGCGGWCVWPGYPTGGEGVSKDL